MGTYKLNDYAEHLIPDLDVPEISQISVQNGNVVISWKPVEYATCYSIHFRTPGDEWQIADIVTTRSYTFENSADKEFIFFIRAGNASLGKTTWSAYSDVQTHLP